MSQSAVGFYIIVLEVGWNSGPQPAHTTVTNNSNMTSPRRLLLKVMALPAQNCSKHPHISQCSLWGNVYLSEDSICTIMDQLQDHFSMNWLHLCSFCWQYCRWRENNYPSIEDWHWLGHYTMSHQRHYISVITRCHISVLITHTSGHRPSTNCHNTHGYHLIHFQDRKESKYFLV